MFPAIGGSYSSAYEILKSLRFRAAASTYIYRTYSSAANRKTFTLHMKVKRGAQGTRQFLFHAGTTAGDSGSFSFEFNVSNQLRVAGGTTQFFLSTPLCRDSSSHMDVVLRVDTTNSTAADRVIVEVNGERITSSAYSAPALNLDTAVGNAVNHYIGCYYSGPSLFFDGHISEFHLIHSQSLDSSYFVRYDASTSSYVPKKFAGNYGSFDSTLDFADGTSLTTLGQDKSGNSNNWTLTNFSLTVGVTYDWSDDTPTNNHCSLNPLIPSAAGISYANMRSSTTAVRGTMDARAIAGYWEVTSVSGAVTAGVINDAGTTSTTTVTATKTFAFRLTTDGTLDYRNVTDSGAWTNIASGLSGNQFPYGITAAADWNFGQRPFVGTVPTGFKSLCTKNMPDGVIITSGTFTGNAAADGQSVFLNGVPTVMTINGNAVTWGTHADKTAYGFKLRTASTSYNASGSNTFSVTSTGAKFKYANAQINP